MRILISPLDWGLGHASRSAAVVKHLLNHHNEVILAGSGDSLRLLQKQFPSLKCVYLSSFSPWTPSWLPFALAFSLQLPYFFFCILREFIAVQRLVKKYDIDLIISDNRYGLHSSLCSSAILTHQLSPIPWTGAPSWIRNAVSWGIAKLLSDFNFCLIPDYPDHRLSGSLSVSKYSISSRLLFLGPLSRYAEYKDSSLPQDITYLGIMTGPAESRIQYEKFLSSLPVFSECSPSIARVYIGSKNHYDSIVTLPDASAREIASLIQRSQYIYSRSGYTTIMDLYCLGALSRARLTPTKGQAEQEYLAALLHTCHL
ncbi:MAG: hypothetical protein MJZ18_04220 [Bacteroidales bacterium]|nr:hypothetical protein [Bacteroidales bacterium]